MKTDRLDRMEAYILETGSVSLPDLAEHFQVSLNTVRRDVTEILARGKIRKVYGGVTAGDTAVTPVAIRESTNASEKEHIGRLAAGLVSDGDTIFLDSGSTTPHLLRFLEGHTGLTVISHNLKVIDAAARMEGINLIAIGGEYNYRTGDFSGIASSTEILERYHITKAFLAATAVSVKFGLTNTSFLEAEMKRRIVEASDRVILMADHSKFSRNAVISFCPLERLEALVTDRKPEEEFVTACLGQNIAIYY